MVSEAPVSGAGLVSPYALSALVVLVPLGMAWGHAAVRHPRLETTSSRSRDCAAEGFRIAE